MILLAACGPARAQQPAGEIADRNDKTGVLEAVGQSIEQNRQLEKQDQQLLYQIISRDIVGVGIQPHRKSEGSSVRGELVSGEKPQLPAQSPGH